MKLERKLARTKVFNLPAKLLIGFSKKAQLIGSMDQQLDGTFQWIPSSHWIFLEVFLVC